MITKRAHTGIRLVWSVALLGVLVSIATPSAAQPSLRLDPTGAALSTGAGTPLEALPGVSFTLVFRLTNTAAVECAADIRVDVPTGWQVLFASDRLALAPQASWLETVSIVPSRTAAAGEYSVRFEARATGEQARSVSVAVRIPTRHGLRLAWDEAPAYLAAGAVTSLGLTITNDGNLVENVALEVRSAAGSTIRAPWTTGTLSPGEARRTMVEIRAPARPQREARDTVTARATIDTASAAAEAGYQFDVVAAGKNAAPPRNALPSALAIRFGSHRDPGFGSFVGSGALDRDRRVTTNFSFATRDRSNPLLLERDEYMLNVSGPRGGLTLGDHVWSMSFLTESGHYGLGAGGRVEAGRWFASGFLDSGRRDFREASQSGGAIGVRLGPTRTSAQYLQRFEYRPGSPTTAEIGSVRLELVPQRGFSGDLELGTGRGASGTGSGSAISAQAAHTSRYITFYGRRVRADAAYPIRDRTALIDGVGLSLRPVGQLQLEGTFDGTEQLPTELLPVNAPTRQRTTHASVAWGSLARVQAGRFEWTTPGVDWAAAWRRESISADLTLPLGWLRLTPGVERGTQTGLGFPETPFSRNSLRASVRWKHSSVSARAEYGRGVLGSADREVRRVSIGGALRPAKATLFRFQANENSVDTPWLEGARWTDVTLEQGLPWPHRLVATYRRYTGGASLLPSSEAYRVDYVIPLGVPLKRSTDNGRITLRLKDADTGEAQPQVLVQIGKTSLLTDRNGAAEFNSVAVGEHFLTITGAALGPDRTIVPAFPLRVDVTPGQSVTIDATVVRTATVSGLVQVLAYESGGLVVGAASSGLVPVRGLAGALIEISGSSDTRRAVTDERGRFAFGGLPPGAYRLRVLSAALPPFYRLERTELSIGVSPGEAQDVSFQVVPKPQGD